MRSSSLARRPAVDLIIATSFLIVSYMLPQSIWPFIPTILGGAGLVYVVIFVLDLARAIKTGVLNKKGGK